MSDEQAKKNIAKNVTHYRGERSRTWLAQTVDTYTINITRIETGEHMPGAGLLTRLAEALEVTIDDLLKTPPKNNRNAG